MLSHTLLGEVISHDRRRLSIRVSDSISIDRFFMALQMRHKPYTVYDIHSPKGLLGTPN